MSNIRTHYDDLQISRTAPEAVVRAAYRALSQQHHPDKNPNDQTNAERRMKVINKAYAVLSDSAKRREHDKWIMLMEANSRKPYIAPQTEKPSQTLQNKKDDSFWGGIVGLIIVGVFLYNKTSDKPAISSPPAVAQVTQQTNILQKSTRPIGLKQQVKPKKSATVSGSRANSNPSHCFNLPTDAEILQCLN